MNYLTDDFKMITVSNREIDKHRLRELLLQTKSGLPDRKVTIQRMMTKDNAAMVESNWTVTHTGEFMGYPASNNRIEFPVVNILEFESGKVKLFKDIFNWSLFERGLNSQ